LGGEFTSTTSLHCCEESRKGIASILSEELNGGVQYVFEFDEAKSGANKAKHGIDFVEAQALWLDGNLLRVAARVGEERRFVFIGLIGDKHWSAVITYRGDTIRLISVRRARPMEVQAYEGE